MGSTISVLIADDHGTLRELLKQCLEEQIDFKVVAHVDDAKTAVDQATALKPHIVLMDIDMPGLSAFDAAERIRVRCPETRILFFTAFVRDRYIERALSVQAWGYISKTEGPDSVIKAIRSVAKGIAYYSPSVQERLVVDSQGTRLARTTRTIALTPREKEVLCYLARGLSKKDIAQTMCVSVKTIEFHSTQLMDKLDIHDRVELTRYAIREGFVEP